VIRRKIKFSHNYNKLKHFSNGDEVILLLAKEIKRSELCPTFIDYDTTFKLANGISQYPLIPGNYILLLFMGLTDNTKLFTTVRPYNLYKFEFYKKLESTIFQIEINEVSNG
jgi:hypothetical protein